MIHRYTLSNSTTMLLCSEHKALAGDSIIADEGRETGGKWRCRICQIHRRLIGEATDPVSVLVGSHVLTRFPTGVVYCDCLAWRFGKVPVADRWCKHMAEVVFPPNIANIRA